MARFTTITSPLTSPFSAATQWVAITSHRLPAYSSASTRAHTAAPRVSITLAGMFGPAVKLSRILTIL